MKKLYLSFLIICSGLNISLAQVTNTWQNYFSDASVKVEFKEVNYQEPNTDINKKLIVFRLTNLTDKKISLDWKQKLQYGTVCYNCTGSSKEMNFTISIEPNSAVEGNPGSHQTNGLVIFSKFNSPEIVKNKTTPLTSYELKNIQVLTNN